MDKTWKCSACEKDKSQFVYIIDASDEEMFICEPCWGGFNEPYEPVSAEEIIKAFGSGRP